MSCQFFVLMLSKSLKHACEIISEEVYEISEQELKHKRTISSRFESE